MKHVTLWLLLVLFLTNCKKIDKIAHFYLEHETILVLDTSHMTGNFYSIVSPQVITHADSIYNLYNTESSLVTQITIESLDIQLDDGDTIPNYNLKSISVYLITTESDEKQIAWNSNLPPLNITPLPLTATTDNLTEMLNKPILHYLIEGFATKDTLTHSNWKLKARYYVNATEKK